MNIALKIGGDCANRAKEVLTMDEKTSSDVASVAASIMGGSPYNHEMVKTLAASCLTQTADKFQTPEQAQIQGLPVAGYKPTQSPEAIAVVNRFKELEERVLREIENLDGPGNSSFADPRLLAIGRTQLQGAFMFLARSIFQPGRVALPEDFKTYDGADTLNVRD